MAAELFLVICGGLVVLGVTIEWYERRVESRDFDRYEHASHERLMREIRRHP